MRSLGCALVVAAGLAFPDAALAYEDQVTVGVGAGYAGVLSDADPRHGMIGDVSFSTGLDPVWTLRSRASYGLKPASQSLHRIQVGTELLYMVDVLTVVPYFGAGVDALARFRSGVSEPELAVHLSVGADYLWSRDIAFELDLRPSLWLTELDDEALHLSAVLSVVFIFDR